MRETAVQVAGHQPPRADTSRNTHAVVLDLIVAHGARRVLDAPCGEGALALELARRGCEPYCLDCEPDALRLEGVDFRVGSLAERLDYPDGFFDAVACVDGIEHLENPFGPIREFARILRPGGRFVLSTPNVSAMRSRVRFLLTGGHNKFKRPLDEANPDPLHHLTPLSYPQLRYLLHTSGFRISAVRANRIKAASYPYALLYPLAALFTWATYRREKNDGQRRRNREILRTLLSPAVFLGETLIVAAERT